MLSLQSLGENLYRKVVVLIPTYNESRTVQNVIAEVRASLPQAGILVINDGSTDNTLEMARRMNVSVLSHSQNLGIGATVQSGLKFALKNGYEIAIQVDGDGQHKPEDLPKLLAPLVRGEADMTIGSRFLGTSEFESTFMRRIGIVFFSFLFFLISGKWITDPTSGYRAMNRKVISLFTKNYPPDYPEPEALVYVHKHHLKIAEVPVSMKPRQAGISSICWSRSIYYMLKVPYAMLLECIRSKTAPS